MTPVSCSFGDMLSFTLTAFVELMDHGIVSWDTFSVAFIKKVNSESMLSVLYQFKYLRWVVIWVSFFFSFFVFFPGTLFRLLVKKKVHENGIKVLFQTINVLQNLVQLLWRSVGVNWNQHSIRLVKWELAYSITLWSPCTDKIQLKQKISIPIQCKLK